MARTMTFYDLHDALAMAGCPVCRLVARAVERYVGALLWEMVNDPESRRDIRQAHGFCANHAWALVRDGPSLGAVIIMHDVMQHTLRAARMLQGRPQPRSIAARLYSQLRGQTHSTGDIAAVSGQLEPRSRCPACEQAEIAEEMCVSILLDHLVGDDGLLVRYQASEGLCLPHFRQVLGRTTDAPAIESLVQAQQVIWTRLVDHLGECIRKCDYRFSDEPRGDERGACARAIAALVGPRPGHSDKEASPVGFPIRERATN